MDTKSKPETIEGQSAEAVVLTPSCSAASRQNALDWGVFSAAFEKRNGFAPHPMDTGHQEYFHWFTVGSHEEFMGRLNPFVPSPPNAGNQTPAAAGVEAKQKAIGGLSA